MRGSSLASRPDSLICPLCEASKLYPSTQDSMRCRSCHVHVQGAILGTLRCISTLPDTLERVMNSIRNGLEMRETEIARGPS
jgi:hypothetical protein